MHRIEGYDLDEAGADEQDGEDTIEDDIVELSRV